MRRAYHCGMCTGCWMKGRCVVAVWQQQEVSCAVMCCAMHVRCAMVCAAVLVTASRQMYCCVLVDYSLEPAACWLVSEMTSGSAVLYCWGA
jgi:hypothetical protein